MDTKFVKVSSHKDHIVVDLKRKRPNGSVNLVGASGQWRKVDCRGSFLPSKSLESYHSNFMKSGMLKRLMYYQHGAWVDFLDDTLDLIKEKFQAKTGTMEVELNGEWFALDFLHMFKLDLQTGLRQRIGWIDEADCCYFPETFDEFCSCNFVEEECGDIKLHLDIEINGKDTSRLKETSEEINPVINDIPEDICVKVAGPPDAEAVRKIFYEGIHLRDTANVISISRGLSFQMESRHELFLKQIEIMQRYRGDANVQYAWLPSSKEISSIVMNHGIGVSMPSKIKPVHGIGFYLIPAKCTELSAKYCDIDENGTRHMILCRVIMGNMELLFPGSEQFHPSSEGFDSGIDDIQNPKHYIVWSMNADTHIYPEYVVSFKMSSDAIGLPVETENMNLPLPVARVMVHEVQVPEVHVPEVQVESDLSASDLTSEQTSIQVTEVDIANVDIANVDFGYGRAPNSPWIPFSLLFETISGEVPKSNMDVVYTNYELFKSGQMTRDDFVRRLRIIVGDQLLRDTILWCHHPMSLGPYRKYPLGPYLQYPQNQRPVFTKRGRGGFPKKF